MKSPETRRFFPNLCAVMRERSFDSPDERLWFDQGFTCFSTRRDWHSRHSRKPLASGILSGQNWLVVGPPLWKILVSWDDYSQYMGKYKIDGNQTTNQKRCSEWWFRWAIIRRLARGNIQRFYVTLCDYMPRKAREADKSNLTSKSLMIMKTEHEVGASSSGCSVMAISLGQTDGW